jgi:hypothetical protein
MAGKNFRHAGHVATSRRRSVAVRKVFNRVQLPRRRATSVRKW